MIMQLDKNDLVRENIRQIFMDVKDTEHKFRMVTELYCMTTVACSIIFTKVGVQTRISFTHYANLY